MVRRSSGEIPTIERQVLTPTVDVRAAQTTAAASAGAELGFLLANKLQDQAVYQSGLAGQLQAEEGRAPKNLPFPLTRATAEYNKAVINTEARNLSSHGSSLITETYAKMSDPAKFNENTPAEFSAAVDGITQGVLDTTRPEARSEVKAYLKEVAERARLKMLDDSIKYDNIKTAAAFNRDLALAQAQRQEAVYSKNQQAIAAANQNIGNLLNDYAIINQQIADQLPDINKKLDDQLKTDEVISDYLQAYRNGNEVQFLDNLTKNKPENLTEVEYFAAMQEVLKFEKTFAATESKYNSEQYAKGHYEIVSGQITSFDQLQQEYGNKVTATAYFALSETLLSQKQSVDAVYEVERARYYGISEVQKLPNKILNDYYHQKEAQEIERINSEQPDNPIVRLNIAQRAESIVLPAGAPIEDFLIDLSVGLKSSSPTVALDALNAYRILDRNQKAFGDTLKGLDSEANDIGQFVMSVGDVSEAETLSLIKTAQDNINDVSDTTMRARKDRLTKMYTLKDGTNTIQNYYKSTYDVLPTSANNDAHYGTFQQLFDSYFMGVANGSETVALAMTTNALRDWKKSKYGQKDEIMYSPPDILPYAQLGHWMDNQVGEALHGLLIKHQEKETGLAVPKWMAELPISNETTDQQLMDTDFYPKRTALVNGIEREVFVNSTRNTRTSAFPGEVYQFYYLDDFGVKQFINDANNPLASANWMARTMDEFVPSVFNSLSEETFNEMAYKIYDKQNTGKTKEIDSLLPATNQSTPYFIDGEDTETGRRLLQKKGKLDQAEIDAIKERLKNVAKKKIVFKDGAPVEGAEQIITNEEIKPLIPRGGKEGGGGPEIDLGDIGRRK